MFSLKLTCPPGQHFSVADNRCTAPEQAACDPTFTAAPAAAAEAEASEAAVNVEAEPEAAPAEVAEAVDVTVVTDDAEAVAQEVAVAA
ncbi:hypothetical protein MRX96_024119 [Rhipicephalus microplus]